MSDPLWRQRVYTELTVRTLERNGLRIHKLSDDLLADISASVPESARISAHTLHEELYPHVLSVAVTMRRLPTVPGEIRRRWQKFCLHCVDLILDPRDFVEVDDAEIMQLMLKRFNHAWPREEFSDEIMKTQRLVSTYYVLLIATMFLPRLRNDKLKVDMEMKTNTLVLGKTPADEESVSDEEADGHPYHDLAGGGYDHNTRELGVGTSRWGEQPLFYAEEARSYDDEHNGFDFQRGPGALSSPPPNLLFYSRSTTSTPRNANVSRSPRAVTSLSRTNLYRPQQQTHTPSNQNRGINPRSPSRSPIVSASPSRRTAVSRLKGNTMTRSQSAAAVAQTTRKRNNEQLLAATGGTVRGPPAKHAHESPAFYDDHLQFTFGD